VSVAQLTAPGMNALRYASYPSTPGSNDPVFIFCNSTGSQKGSLQAVSPGGVGPFSFVWSKWSDDTKSFSIPIRSDLSSMSSSCTGLDEGGYRVRITNGSGYDKSLTGWIFLDNPYALAKLQNFTCDYVALSGKAAIDTFFYKDPSNGNFIKLRNAVGFNWSSTPSSTIPYPDLEINPVTFTPPLEDVTYKLAVVDSFKCASESSFPYTSIHVKADFSVDPEKGEAPLKVRFTNKSIRGDYIKWEFGDDSTSSVTDSITHIYYRPGEYSIKLTAESKLHCIDSMRFEKVVVEPSDLNIPNVFTPNGDGINDYFNLDSKSLRSISVEIFSKSGIMVYRFYGDKARLDGWKGWDGNVNSSSIKATPGVYYYIIRAKGWDDKIYDGTEYRGFLYLYR